MWCDRQKYKPGRNTEKRQSIGVDRARRWIHQKRTTNRCRSTTLSTSLSGSLSTVLSPPSLLRSLVPSHLLSFREFFSFFLPPPLDPSMSAHQISHGRKRTKEKMHVDDRMKPTRMKTMLGKIRWIHVVQRVVERCNRELKREEKEAKILIKMKKKDNRNEEEKGKRKKNMIKKNMKY
jgi:hypothetical protein